MHLATVIVLRAGFFTRGCREEQGGCTPYLDTEWRLGVGSLAAAVGCLVLVVLLYSRLVSRRSNLHQVSWLQARIVAPLVVVGVVLEWTAEFQSSLSEAGRSSPRNRMAMLSGLLGVDMEQPLVRHLPARLVYAMCAGVLVFTWIQPANVRIVFPVTGKEKAVKMEGVPTLFSSAIVLLVSTLVLPIMMITDIPMVPGVLLAVASAALLVHVASCRYEVLEKVRSASAAGRTVTSREKRVGIIQTAKTRAGTCCWQWPCIETKHTRSHGALRACLVPTDSFLCLGLIPSDRRRAPPPCVLVHGDPVGPGNHPLLLRAWIPGHNSQHPLQQRVGRTCGVERDPFRHPGVLEHDGGADCLHSVAPVACDLALCRRGTSPAVSAAASSGWGRVHGRHVG